MRALWSASSFAIVASVLTACGGSGHSSSMVAASQQDVSFVVDGTKTYATLDIPAHRRGQHLGAALLVAGSGPTDRNGDQADPNQRPHTLQLLAQTLDQDGVMSLRFDKYFSGRTGAGKFAANPGTSTVSAFIKQADAAYTLLRGEPATDPDRMLVVGHSEGGLFAMLIAESVAPHPAGLALIEPQDDRDLSLVQVQLDGQLDGAVTNGTLTAAAARQNSTIVHQAISDFRAGRPVDTGGLLPGLATLLDSTLAGTNAAYTRSDDAIYPPDVAARLPRGIRVLVTDGTKDPNIPPSSIGPLVRGLAAAGPTGPGLRTLTGLDHDLHPDGAAKDAPLAPAAVSAIKDWAVPFAGPR